eukprot:CAMPEP_0172820732 /NCGR_PEP_ID=MMETSP1075-20121228/15463_1 /TAXON_ID=2916 /ORGANISM="Ceratium fusus, Strain PA161109" /LENGTH=515 /DNA_ID=CAMNT_0013661449 /DNA_START=12 /DNA_END=1555 /DNA_ORIENTATION=+
MLGYKLSINGCSRLSTRHFTAKDHWGWRNFADSPQDDVVLQVRTWDPAVVVTSENAAEWNISLKRCEEADKSCTFESQKFQLNGRTLCLHFYPKGSAEATVGKCSAFLWSTDEGPLGFELVINGIQRAWSGSFAAWGTRGWRDFANTPEEDVKVEIRTWEPDQLLVKSDCMAEWVIPKCRCCQVGKMEALDSQKFTLGERSLWLRFYPKGDAEAEPENCSVYLFSEDEGPLGFELTLDDCSKSSTALFTDDADNFGWRHFAKDKEQALTLRIRTWDPTSVVSTSSTSAQWHVPQTLHCHFGQGGALESHRFPLGGRTCWIRFYPRGDAEANEGKCSLFLCSQDNGLMGYELALNGFSRQTTDDFLAGANWGWRDFAPTPEGDALLEVQAFDPACVVVAPEKDSAEWHIPGGLCNRLIKGAGLDSQRFTLVGRTFWLRFHPNGDAKAPDGRCSAFLFSEADHEDVLGYEVSLKGQTRGGCDRFEVRDNWGWHDFAEACTTGEAVTLSLRAWVPNQT